MRFQLFALAPLTILIACADTGTLVVADPNGLGGDDTTATDTDIQDTDAGGGGGQDTDGDTGSGGGGGGPVESWDHALGELTLLGSGQGFDLDGDGQIDNALGGFARYLGGALSGLVQNAGTVGIIQTWGVNDGNNRVQIGIVSGTDTDNDPSDNFSGSESFDVSSGLLPNGRAEIVAATALDPANTFEARIAAGSFTIAGFTLPTSTDVFISGTVTKDAIDGQIGTAIPTQVITDLLDQNGLGFLTGLVDGAADVDVDGDGTDDSISLAVAFKGVPCTIVAVAP